MKKILTVLLALVMVLALCGCDSADYKKAKALFDTEDYTAAREMFVALGDYEDSAAMVTECDYYQACAMLENGQFEVARQMFLALGDYKDSQQLAVNAAWYMLHAYVASQGDLERVGFDHKTTNIYTHEDTLCLAYNYRVTGMINIDLEIGATIDIADGRAILSGLDTSSSYAANYDASGGADWDISTYRQGDTLAWETFEVEGTTAQGTPYTQELTMLDMLLTAAVKEMVLHLEQVLTDSNLGLTMADIGFASY